MYMDQSTAKQNLDNLQGVLPGIDMKTIQRDIEGTSTLNSDSPHIQQPFKVLEDGSNIAASLLCCIPSIPILFRHVGRCADFELWYFPHSLRTFNQYVSVLVTSMCLAVVFVLALVLFEIEEFVEDTTSRQTAFLIKGVMGGVLIPIINSSYDSVATWLTAREFHPTVPLHDRSIALKKFSASKMTLIFTTTPLS